MKTVIYQEIKVITMDNDKLNLLDICYILLPNDIYLRIQKCIVVEVCSEKNTYKISMVGDRRTEKETIDIKYDAYYKYFMHNYTKIFPIDEQTKVYLSEKEANDAVLDSYKTRVELLQNLIKQKSK